MKYKPEIIVPSTTPRLVEYLDRELNRISAAITTSDGEWEDVRVSLTAARAATYTPGYSKFRDNGSGSNGVNVWWFDPSSIEELFFDIQLPHAFWHYHGELRPHIHWSPGNSTSTNVVRWGLEFTVANYQDAFPTTTISYVNAVASGTPYEHQIAKFNAIDASNISISSVILCRLFRDATNAADTFTTDAAALSVDFHVQLNTRGSEQEYKKTI